MFGSHGQEQVGSSKVVEQKVVSIADFRKTVHYTAICPVCGATNEVHGYATRRPPLCKCNTPMIAICV